MLYKRTRPDLTEVLTYIFHFFVLFAIEFCKNHANTTAEINLERVFEEVGLAQKLRKILRSIDVISTLLRKWPAGNWVCR